MRIDKFLKVSRLLKRRTLANEAASGGRVSVNGRPVKPAFQVKVGDIVEIGFNSGTVKFEVLELKETVKKEQAENLYRIIILCSLLCWMGNSISNGLWVALCSDTFGTVSTAIAIIRYDVKKIHKQKS